MIDINLLPEDMKKKPAKAPMQISFTGKLAFLSRFSLKTWLIVAGSAVVGFVLISLLLVLFVPTAVIQSKLKYIEERSAVIKKDVELSSRMEKEEEEIKKTVSMMQKLEKDRLLWAQLMNDLSDAAPAEIRLTKLYYKEELVKVAAAPKKEKAKEKKTKEAPAAGADKKEKAAKKEKAPKRSRKEAVQKKTMRYLMLEGVLEAGRDEGVVNGFIENLKESGYYSTLFADISLVGVSILPDGKKAVTIRSHFKEKKNETANTDTETQSQ